MFRQYKKLTDAEKPDRDGDTEFLDPPTTRQGRDWAIMESTWARLSWWPAFRRKPVAVDECAQESLYGVQSARHCRRGELSQS
jgi:hypothetical protein